MNLKIVGEVDGSDWKIIRDMAGRDFYGKQTDGKLRTLDLSEARIVLGGNNYCYGINTSDDVLGEYAFCGCNNLTHLDLPSGVRSIGRFAFSGCSNLSRLSLPSEVTSIGSYAFEGCSGLIRLSLPPGVTSIGSSAFVDCGSLVELSLPSSITSIGASAFAGCRSLKSLVLPPGLTSIANSLFCGCRSLTSLSIPTGITSIGTSAFEGCSGLTSIYVHAEQLPKLGKHVFKGCNAKKCTLYIPKGTYDEYWVSEFGNFKNIVEFDPAEKH